jgi:hypothetical protein
MKNLKMFEDWIDNETEDTNRRLAELDAKDFGESEEIITDDYEKEFDNKIRELILLYKDKLSRDELSEILEDFSQMVKYSEF